MAHFVFADDSIIFDGQSLERGPLGGAESAFIRLVQALARRGHRVDVYNRCAHAMDDRGVSWRRLGDAWPDGADVYVANRGWHLIDRMPQVKSRFFWIHNPATYLLKWRYGWRLAAYRPRIVFSGAHHAHTYRSWAPPWGLANSRLIIPYGIDDMFLGAMEKSAAPAPKVIFTSNPLRSLDWLLALWRDKIHPRLPAAELHIFSGAKTYGAQGSKLDEKMQVVLQQAAAMRDTGVVLREPLPKSALVAELATARAMLYRGDVGETFCLALAEAQAMGVPAVVRPIGCVAERVVDGMTGHVGADDDDFVAKSIAVLSDDRHWLNLHRNALRLQRDWGWPQAAASWESYINI